jgi:hypothetical protein
MAGLIVQFVGVPPERDGVWVVMAVSFFKIKGEELYTREVGAVAVPTFTTEI